VGMGATFEVVLPINYNAVFDNSQDHSSASV
jgi:hypothetical protein